MARFYILILAAAILLSVPYAEATRRQRGPADLPYSCAVVRWAVATFPWEWLEKQADIRGLTQRQRDQAAECLKG